MLCQPWTNKSSKNQSVGLKIRQWTFIFLSPFLIKMTFFTVKRWFSNLRQIPIQHYSFQIQDKRLSAMTKRPQTTVSLSPFLVFWAQRKAKQKTWTRQTTKWQWKKKKNSRETFSSLRSQLRLIFFLLTGGVIKIYGFTLMEDSLTALH